MPHSLHATSAALPTRTRADVRVVAVEPLCTEHYWLELSACIPLSHAGQFVQLQSNHWLFQQQTSLPAHTLLKPGSAANDHPIWSDQHALLRRPFSVASVLTDSSPNTDGCVEQRVGLLLRRVGPGTAWLSRLEAGTTISLIGPIGQGFWEWPVRTHWLIGGGVGIPPTMRLAQQWSQACRTPDAVAFVAAQSRDLIPLPLTFEPSPLAMPLPCVQPFADYGLASVVSTDDGSCGLPGRVTDALEAALVQRFEHPPVPEGFLGWYVCGSTPMMRAVARLAQRWSVPTQVCLEQAMACGLGTCQSCVVRVRCDTPARPEWAQLHTATGQHAGQSYQYALCCSAGPVMDARAVLW